MGSSTVVCSVLCVGCCVQEGFCYFVLFWILFKRGLHITSRQVYSQFTLNFARIQFHPLQLFPSVWRSSSIPSSCPGDQSLRERPATLRGNHHIRSAPTNAFYFTLFSTLVASTLTKTFNSWTCQYFEGFFNN